MNGIVKSAVRTLALRGVLSSMTSTSSSSSIAGQPVRALWNTCESRRAAEITPLVSSYKLHDFHARRCYSGSHTKGEKEFEELKEIADFLFGEERVAEKKAQKLKTIPTTLDGLTVSLNGAEVHPEKQDGTDKIHTSFNVNHMVDADAEADVDPRQDDVELGEMRSMLIFTVDDSCNDISCFEGITFYEGEHSERVYSVADELLDDDSLIRCLMMTP